MRLDTLDSVHQRLDRSAGKAIEDSHYSSYPHHSDYSGSDDELVDYGEIDRSEASAYKQYLNAAVLAAGPDKKTRKGLFEALKRAKGTYTTWKEAFEKNADAFEAVFATYPKGNAKFKEMLDDIKEGPLQKKKKTKGGSGHSNIKLVEDLIGILKGTHSEGSGHGGEKKKKNRRRFNHANCPDPRYFQRYDKASKTYRDINIDELLVKIGTPERAQDGSIVLGTDGKPIKQFLEPVRINGVIQVKTVPRKNKFGHTKDVEVPITNEIKRDEMEIDFKKAHQFMKDAWEKAGKVASNDVKYTDLVTRDGSPLEEAQTKALDTIKWGNGLHCEHGKSKVNRETFNEIEQRRGWYYFIIRNAMEGLQPTIEFDAKIKANVETIRILSRTQDRANSISASSSRVRPSAASVDYYGRLSVHENPRELIKLALKLKLQLAKRRVEKLKNETTTSMLAELEKRRRQASTNVKLFQDAVDQNESLGQEGEYHSDFEADNEDDQGILGLINGDAGDPDSDINKKARLGR